VSASGGPLLGGHWVVSCPRVHNHQFRKARPSVTVRKARSPVSKFDKPTNGAMYASGLTPAAPHKAAGQPGDAEEAGHPDPGHAAPLASLPPFAIRLSPFDDKPGAEATPSNGCDGWRTISGRFRFPFLEE
jgi:hypothetical protein